MPYMNESDLVADDEPGVSTGDPVLPPDERDRRAALWHAGADERERLADEREAVADERERLADERERLADAHERTLDQRTEGPAGGDLNHVNEQAEIQAAIERAEARLQLAQAQLERARDAGRRAAARSARLDAEAARSTAAELLESAAEPDERAWLVDRRDFVAADRDARADQGDRLADQRDDIADRREHQADDRERSALARERQLDDHRSAWHTRGAVRIRGESLSDLAGQRARQSKQRDDARAKRRAAARSHARAADTWGPPTYGPKLLASFAQLARGLFAAETLTESLPQLLAFTVAAVDDCDCASVTIWRNGRAVQTTASNAVATKLDDIQLGIRSGPAIDALHDTEPVYVSGLDVDPRWPVLAQAAGQLGIVGALSHGLYVHGSSRSSAHGTFTLYATAPDAFNKRDREHADIIAAYLSIAVAAVERRYQLDQRESALHRALSTRDVIGQAKGILMERRHLTAGEAFDLLRRVSQQLNRSVNDLAQHVAQTGELPT
jgi:hypothetical protein